MLDILIDEQVRLWGELLSEAAGAGDFAAPFILRSISTKDRLVESVAVGSGLGLRLARGL